MANVSLRNQPELTTKTNKNTTSLPPIINPAVGQAKNETNLNKVLVLTKNDLDRISGHLNRRQNEETEMLEEMTRKKELYEKSQALTKSWNNTIQGSRRFKLQQKQIREEKLEEQRRQVDLEHAQYMAEERKKALEQAKLLQYHETDRVKTFHSAMRLSEVLKEREAQLEMKKLLNSLNKDEEVESLKKLEEMLREKDLKDAELNAKKQEETNKVLEYRKQQIKDHAEKVKKMHEEKILDKKRMEELNAQYIFEQEKLDQIRHQKVKDLKETYDNALANRRKIIEAEKLLDEEENEELRIYANAKKKMAILKRQKEDEIRKEKEENKEKMMSYLGSLLKQQVADEDFRIAKAVAKNEARLAQEEYEKYMRAQKELKEINDYRLLTIKRKEIEALRQQKEDDEDMRKKVETDMLHQLYEAEKSKQRGEKMKEIAKGNLQIAKERGEDEKRIRQSDKDHVLKEMELLELEDAQFKNYADRVIDYMGKHGRNTYPMKKVVYDAIKPKDSDQEKKSPAKIIKEHQNNVPTNKNLGFN